LTTLVYPCFTLPYPDGCTSESDTRLGELAHGISFENLSVSLELPRADHVDYVAVTLVTPAKDEAKTKRIFEKFVSQLKFW
jgi:hypothetical protein